MYTHLTNDSKWNNGRFTVFGERDQKVGFEWVLFTKTSFAISLTWKSGETLALFHIGIPLLFTLFLSIEKGYYGDGHELSIRVFDKALWWMLWMNPVESHSTDPKWRRGCWRPLDTLLGRQEYSKLILQKGVCTVEMPEGVYFGTYEHHAAQWKRKRWPRAEKVSRFEIDFSDEPIPEPGKGENSWDMGDDALYTMLCAADTLPEAIEEVRKSVMYRRERYGGLNWKPPTNSD